MSIYVMNSIVTFAMLVKNLGKQVNFMNFCNPSPPHSMACESIDREELLKLIDNLNNNKSHGPDNFVQL